MATKMYNKHLDMLLYNSKKYGIYDVYIRLVDISNEITRYDSDNKKTIHFFIQTGYISYNNTSSLEEERKILVDCLHSYLSFKKSTIHNIICELEELNIIKFNIDENAWELLNMNYMFLNKDDCLSLEEKDMCVGYTPINEFLFSNEFFEFKPIEKRLFIYMCKLKGYKKTDVYKRTNLCDFKANVLDNKSEWLKVLRTSSKYYAKYKISSFIEKYSNKRYFQSSFNNGYTTKKSVPIMEEANTNYSLPKKYSQFIFSFNAPILSLIVDDFSQVKKNHTSDINLINYMINQKNEYQKDYGDKEIVVSEKQVLQIARAVCNVENFIVKELAIKKILDKFVADQVHNNDNPIRSLPAFAYSMVKSSLAECRESKDSYWERNKNLINKIEGLAY